MLVLGIDTATPAVTVAVHDGSAVLASACTVDARRHGELLAPTIERVLTEAAVSLGDVDVVAVGVGPGPYTGLRVGVVTGLAIADAIGAAAHGVCTLDVIAAQLGAGQPLTVVTDARRREVFWASYDEQCTRVAGPAVGRPVDVAATVSGRVLGSGAAMYANVFGTVPDATDIADEGYPDAGTLCALVAANRVELRDARPIYLRRPDTTEPHAPKSVLPT